MSPLSPASSLLCISKSLPSLGLGLPSDKYGDTGCLALPQGLVLVNEVSGVEVLWKGTQGPQEAFGSYRWPRRVLLSARLCLDLSKCSAVS